MTEELTINEQFLDAVNASILVHDLEGCLIYVNETGCRSLGYTKAELIGMNLRDLDVPELAGQIGSRMQELLFKSESTFESMRLRKDKSTFPVEIRARVIHVGEKNYVINVIYDITARKQEEDRIIKLNETLRAIRNVNQLITRERNRENLIRETCRLLVANQSYTLAWIVLLDKNKNFITAAYAGEKESSDFIERLKQNDYPSCISDMLTQNQRFTAYSDANDHKTCVLNDNHRCAFIGRLEHNGQFYGVIGIHALPQIILDSEEWELFQEMVGDISFALAAIELEADRHQAEIALKESENKFRSLVNNIKLGIFRSTPGEKGKFLEVNKAMEEITGYSREELLRMDVSNLYTYPEERGKFIGEVVRVKGKMTPELMFKKKDGTQIIITAIDVAVLDDSGKVIYVDGILEDITERKRAEATARETETLRHLDKAKSELLANVSHELRTPLASIKGFIETLIEPDVKWSKKEQLDFLQSANQEADHLTFLIRDLLDMSRIDSGKIILDKRYCQVNEVMDSAQNVLLLMAAKHKLKIKLSPDLPAVKVDKARIAQVITNLVENAAKFSPGGSPITIEARIVNDNLIISVRDKGEGISEEAIKNLFNRFYQAERVVSGKDPGDWIRTGDLQGNYGSAWR